MYKREKNSWIKHFDFLIADAVMIEFTFFISYILRHGLHNPLSNEIYSRMSFILLLLDLLVVLFAQSYKDVLKRGFFVEMKKVFSHVSILIMLAFMYMFFAQSSEDFSRAVFGITWILGFLFLYGERILLKAYIRRRMVYRMDKRAMILVTTMGEVENIIHNFSGIYYRDYKIDGIVLIDDIKETVREVTGVPVVGNAETALEYISRNVVDELFINISGKYKQPLALLSACEEMGITTHLVLVQKREMSGEQIVEQIAGYAVLTSSFCMAEPTQLFLKRIMDIIGGLIGLLLTGILFLFVAPIIKAQSPGPIFFRQERVGLNGRKFKLYKFRSMYTDAEGRKKELMAENEMNGFMFKIKDDPRIFPFGKFIRKTSIDEFPQFWNVLKGDMSLVGTRPPTVEEYEHYSPHHKKRLIMKPGITGLWQVSGRSEITDFEDVVRLDTKYISNWDISQDLKILGMTVVTVLRRKGSS